MKINLWGIVEIIIGLFLISTSIVLNTFDTYISCISTMGDQWVVTGYFATLFPLHYGFGIVITMFGYYKLKQKG